MNKHQKSKRIILTFVIILFLATFLVASTNNYEVQASDPEPFYKPIDRFGITIPYNTGVESLIESINVRAVLDWRLENTTMNLPDNVEYIHVVRVSDDAWANGTLLTTLSSVVANNLGDVWIIGNEPDRKDLQDSISAEVYAQRYYEIALKIRHFDPTAKIGFGSVVQPTPIRIRYLERALNRLTYLSCGNRQAALDLIDIWSIHSFILNEHPSEGWGAGVPVGFENDWSDAIRITDYSDTYSSEIFIQRIRFFRDWMKSNGEEDKPLWITEYGSLFPEWEVICQFYPSYNCASPSFGWPSEDDAIQFLQNTFYFMNNERNTDNGFSEDDNKLVQRWFWYSLDDTRYKTWVDEWGNERSYGFGGTLFDPDNGFEITRIGQAFESYTTEIETNPPIGDNPVLYRQSEPVYPVHYDESSDTLSYPFATCHLTHLPLVIK